MTRPSRLVLVKEIREMRRDARLAAAVWLCFLLVAVASVGGFRHYQMMAQQKVEAAQTERTRWLNLPDFGLHGAAHFGLYVFKPETLLTAFDPGVEQFLGVSVWLEAHKQNKFVYRPLQDAAPVQRFFYVTPAAAIQLFGPLLIVLLGCSAFAGERDQGTLRQLASIGVDGRSLLLGKATAIAGALLLVLLPAVAVAIAAGLGSGAGIPWLRLALLAFVYCLYLGAFLGLTLAITARAESARSALALLLAIWVVNGFLVPRAAAEVADWAAPLPSATAWQAEMETEIRDGHAHALEFQVKQELLARYGLENADTLPVNWRGIMLQRGEEQNYPVFDAHFGQLFDKVRQQDIFFQWGGLLAPALTVQSLSMGLAGSDFEHHQHFVRAAEDHRRVIQKTLNEELTLHPEKEWGEYSAGPEVWARVPEFRYGLPDPRDLSWHYAPAALILAGWFVFAWLLALRATTALRP
jgi:ABC-2 type transport system permease protein